MDAAPSSAEGVSNDGVADVRSIERRKEHNMRTGRTIRRLLAALALAVTLALPAAGVALGAAPHHVMLPDAACNDGTAAARLISENGIVPMYMTRTPIGCMTMPGAFLP